MTNRQLKRHIRKIRTKRFWAVILILLAVFMLLASMWLTDVYYQIWLSPDPAGKAETQVASIERAIRVHPIELEGYNKILDIYLKDGLLDEDEHARFQKLLNEHQEQINRKQEVFVSLYRRLAFVYLSAYHADVEGRLEKAHTYLEISQPFGGGTQIEVTTINAYLEIQSYYDQYVRLQGSLRKPTGGEVSDIIRRMVAMFDTLQQASDADRLAYALVVTDLLDRHGTMWVSMVEYSKVAGLVSEISEQLEKDVSDPTALRLKQSLKAWVNERHPWEVQ